MKVKAYGKSHIGLKRKLNEDNYLIAPELGLFLIADGMGGHKGGEIASRMVMETMSNYWIKYKNEHPPVFMQTIDRNISEKAKHFVNSIIFTNVIIYEAQQNSQYHRMGSTVSALLLEGDCIWLANVGDSPIFLLDRGRLIQISEEHSVEAEQRNRGMTDFLGETNPMLKNVLTRVLGLNVKVDVYIHPIRPEVGDLVMVCSDGLTNYISKQLIRTILRDTVMPLEKKVDLLIEKANQGGGGDNITVILLQVLELGERGFLQNLKRQIFHNKF